MDSVSMDFRGISALVTGAASGIGAVVAQQLARMGASVVAVDVDGAGADRIAQKIVSSGGRATPVSANLVSEDAAQSAVRCAVEKFGGLDVAVNCAGIGAAGVPTHEMGLEQCRKVLDVNLVSVFLCVKYQLAQFLLQARGGSIVNISSTAGMRGYRGGAEYAMSKHGVLGLTRSAALEYAGDGIRVNAVCPGPVNTPMLSDIFKWSPDVVERFRRFVPLGQFAEPEDVASAVVWLSSRSARHVTGVALPVDGGLSAQAILSLLGDRV